MPIFDKLIDVPLIRNLNTFMESEKSLPPL